MKYRNMRFPNGKPKAATFSYDDNCRADIRLSKLFNDYALKATFNVNSDFIGKSSEDWHLTADEVKEHIISAGHEVANHGAQHKANGVMRPVEGILDALKCRVGLENAFDIIVRGMAYPDNGILRFANGTTYEDVKAYLKELDIAYARTLGGKNESFDLPSDWYKWLPTGHHDHPEMLELVDKFVNLKMSDFRLEERVPKLFYLWGHAYEFNKNDNWDRIETICQKISGKDDIWYATNIEIYDYVMAYNSLIFSADSSRVYNPTITKVWFEVDDVPYEIEPGQTIKL